MTNDREKRRVSVMEETGEQCTVVFVSIVTEQTNVGRGGQYSTPTHTHTNTLAGSVTIYAKTTLLCSLDSSMVSVKMFRNYK